MSSTARAPASSGLPAKRAASVTSSGSSSSSSSSSLPAAPAAVLEEVPDLDPATVAVALRPDGLIERAVVSKRLETINALVPLDHPFWDRAISAWQRRFRFDRVKSALSPLFTSAPPVRDWAALVRLMLALAPDCLAQLMRAWPDADGPTDLVQAMAVFSDASLPVAVRCAFDHDFTGAHRAAKRARGADGLPHPMPSAATMAAVLATPPRAILRRAEQAAEQAAAASAAASQRVAQLEPVTAATACAVDGLRQTVTSMSATVSHQSAQLRAEIDGLRHLLSHADSAAVGGLRAALADAERRMQDQEGRSGEAVARVRATELQLARQQQEIDDLRHAAGQAAPAVAQALRREVLALETSLSQALEAQRGELAALQRAALSGEPAVAGAIRAEVAAIEARVGRDSSEMRRELSALRGHIQADAAQRDEHWRVIDALRANAAASDPAASAANIRRELGTYLASETSGLRSEVAAVSVALREEVATLRHLIHNAGAQASEPLLTALRDAEARMQTQMQRSAAADARVAAAERALAAQREEIAQLREAAAAMEPATTAVVRRELRALEGRMHQRRPSPPRSRANRGRDRVRRRDGGSDSDATSAASEPDDSDEPPEDPTDCVQRSARHRTRDAEVGLDKIEFYLRGPKAISFWASKGIGSVPYLTELFKVYWTKFIVGRLTGSDAAQASVMLDILLLACRDFHRGTMPSDTARALSHSVLFITAKAGYGAHKATVVCDLYRQDHLDADFRRVVQAASTIVSRDAKTTPPIVAQYRSDRATRPAAPDRVPARERKPSASGRPNDRSTSRKPRERERGGRGRGERGRGRSDPSDAPKADKQS